MVEEAPNAPRVNRVLAAFGAVRRRRRLMIGLQTGVILATVAFCVVAERADWSKAESRIADADIGFLLLALATVTVYYLVFILGWIRMLAAWNIRVTYR